MSIPKVFTMLGTSKIEVLISAAGSEGARLPHRRILRPGGGPPPHVHAGEDEFLMPLQGSFDYFDGTDWGPMV